MAPAAIAEHAAAAGAEDEAFLDEVGLDDVLEGVARFGEGGGEGFDADGAAAMVLGHALEVAVVHGVEADAVDLEAGEGDVGDRAVDGVGALDESEVADAAEEAEGFEGNVS